MIRQTWAKSENVFPVIVEVLQPAPVGFTLCTSSVGMLREFFFNAAFGPDAIFFFMATTTQQFIPQVVKPSQQLWYRLVVHLFLRSVDGVYWLFISFGLYNR